MFSLIFFLFSLPHEQNSRSLCLITRSVNLVQCFHWFYFISSSPWTELTLPALSQSVCKFDSLYVTKCLKYFPPLNRTHGRWAQTYYNILSYLSGKLDALYISEIVYITECFFLLFPPLEEKSRVLSLIYHSVNFINISLCIFIGIIFGSSIFTEKGAILSIF